MTWSRLKDVTVLSIVLILFLCYPMLSKLAFSTLKCLYIGDGRMYLMADLEEPCFEGRHLTYVLTLTVPQLILWVAGMPLVATWLIVRSGSRLYESKRLHMRYSLLFAGYSEGREWWEAVIVVRKLSLVVLGTFGSMMQSVEMTSSISLIIVFLSIIAHLIGKPFGTESRRATRLHLLELMALFVVWFINWVGQMLFLGTSSPVRIFLTILIVFTISCYLMGALYAYSLSVRQRRREKNKTKQGLRKVQPVGKTAVILDAADLCSPPQDATASDGNDNDDENYMEEHGGTLEHAVSAIHREHDLHEKALEIRNEKRKRASLARNWK
jgi:hypothetical protein